MRDDVAHDEDEVIDELYRSYGKWKTHYAVESAALRAEQFALELRRAGVAAGARLLEVGFGAGAFLDWARDAGYRVSGVDISPEFVEAARARGHDVRVGTIEEALADLDESLDAIVCFDVLEHLSLPELTSAFKAFSRSLRRGGKVVARFPNGASPFGRYTQFGDLTHRSVLTPSAVGQLAATAGMTLVAQFNAARARRGAGRGLKGSRVARGVVYAVRDAVNFALASVYFGRAVPLDPNVTVVLEKT